MKIENNVLTIYGVSDCIKSLDRNSTYYKISGAFIDINLIKSSKNFPMTFRYVNKTDRDGRDISYWQNFKEIEKKRFEKFTKWVDYDSIENSLRIDFVWDNVGNIGEIKAHTIGYVGGKILENHIFCTRKEFDAAKKMGSEILAMIILG